MIESESRSHSSRATDVEVDIIDYTDRISPHIPESLGMAQASLVEGDLEEAVYLAEESSGMDKLEEI